MLTYAQVAAAPAFAQAAAHSTSTQKPPLHIYSVPVPRTFFDAVPDDVHRMFDAILDPSLGDPYNCTVYNKQQLTMIAEAIALLAELPTIARCDAFRQKLLSFDVCVDKKYKTFTYYADQLEMEEQARDDALDGKAYVEFESVHEELRRHFEDMAEFFEYEYSMMEACNEYSDYKRVSQFAHACYDAVSMLTVPAWTNVDALRFKKLVDRVSSEVVVF